ncbi:MAG TPA: redoxin family protein [Gemmatimonadaceae bacterium]|jgi:thiol-disulfide isomerase/thioredoxin
MSKETDQSRRVFLERAALAAAVTPLRRWERLLSPPASLRQPPTAEGPLDALRRANGWVNSRPLTASDLRGKVVLVQFWTFTCINWLRTLPYTRAWAEKYRDAGLVVIGAHTPEFPFEHDAANVQRLTADLNVPYPVAIDSDYAIWNAFKNQYWPAIYLLDGAGRVVHQQFGEGGYDDTERMIQKTLEGAGARKLEHQLVSVAGKGLEAAADWNNARSPETYVGYQRTEGFASPGDAVPERSHVYELPSALRLNQWALTGDWTVASGAITANRSAARVVFRFHSRDLHLVMGPPAGRAPVNFRVSIDGAPPGMSHGGDVDADGMGVAKDQRVHQLLRQTGAIEDRTFQIEFREPGAQVFSFTFG